MILRTIVFLLGVTIPISFSCLPSFEILLLCVLALLASKYLLSVRYTAYFEIYTIFILGIAWFCYRASHYEIKISAQYFNVPIVVSGIVSSYPEYDSHKVTFTYILDTINAQSVSQTKVVLNQYRYDKLPLLKVQKGERWQLTIRLKQPRGFWNRGSFDQQAWLLQHGILATGNIVKFHNRNTSVQSLQSQKITLLDLLFNNIHQIRSTLKEYIHRVLSKNICFSLLQALIIGVRKEILPRQWEVMRATGTNHLFAISGLHIGFVGGMFYKLARLLSRCIPQIYLRIPAHQIAHIVAWIGALIYSIISGFALPIQRTMIMFTLFTMTVLSRRITSPFRGWSFALLMLIFINPLVVLSESFWLSFSAVAIIFYSLGSRLHIYQKYSFVKKLWNSLGHTQWIISLGLLPITLWFFQQLSILGIFANLIAIPCVGFIVLPVSLIGILFYPVLPVVTKTALVVSGNTLHYLWMLLSYMADLSFSHYFLTIPNLWVLMSIGCSTLLLITPRGFPSRYYLGAIGFLPLLVSPLPGPLYNDFWLTVLDVGQGLSIIIRTHKHTLVYDTGPRFSARADAGDRVILPYLRHMGIRQIDRLIVSHGDSDHSGGVSSLMKSKMVKSVLASELNRLNIKSACYCQKGQTWEWEGITFSIIHPVSYQALKGNNGSCVLEISNQKYRVLIPGDIHRKGETILLKNNPMLKPVTVLVAPHHGSKTSSSINFIKQVRPQHTLFSTGYGNRFKFPHAIVVDRYQQYRSQIYSTAQEGMITIKFESERDHPILETFYQTNRKFWHKRLLSSSCTYSMYAKQYRTHPA